MNNDTLAPSLTDLATKVVSTAIDSGLTTEQAIACFGLASKILMESAAASGGKIDPHTAFAKGLAQFKDIQATAYH